MISVADFREGGPKSPPHHPWAAPKKPILNRVNCVEQILFVLSAVNSGVSVAPLATVTGSYVNIASVAVGLVFTVSKETAKNIENNERKKTRKTINKMFCQQKVSLRTQTIIFEAIINAEISQEEFLIKENNFVN